jgi:7,8-dihydropterin-6-yl-methyl-4-(beta-D-ribofuranosyl)aminobenzene 5'-phosphate synthase
MLDDQSLFFDSPNGLVIVLGCGHSGIANILNYVAKLSGEKHFFAVTGGMHLLNAGSEQIENVIELFRQYDVQKIGAAHCTGSVAIKRFEESFPERCFMCSAGTRIELGD